MRNQRIGAGPAATSDMSDKKHEYILAALGALLVGVMLLITLLDTPKLRAKRSESTTYVTVVKTVVKENGTDTVTEKAADRALPVFDEENKSEASGVYEGPVNLNTASIEELMSLDGIGEKKAQDIIDYRNDVGRFEETADIMNIEGIGEGTYEKIAGRLTV